MESTEQKGKGVNIPHHQKVDQLTSIIYDLREHLQQLKISVCELNSLQSDFKKRLTQIMEKENIQKNVQIPCFKTMMIDSETQTNEQPPRRWNSDLSLDMEVKSNLNRLHMDDKQMCISSEAITLPVIRPSLQRKPSNKAKFTNRVDVSSTYFSNNKHPGENLLLSDLGFTSQAPEFSQSEFNLSSDDHWNTRENVKGGGRVRFLSHDDGQSCLKPLNQDGMENDYLNKSDKLSQSGSWVTLTHSERDVSELDSTFSLNFQYENAGMNQNKPITSTPYKMQGLRSRLKQSVSFNDLLPSKSFQSKQLESSLIAGDLIASGIRPGTSGLANSIHSSCLDPLLQPKRHSMAAVDSRPNASANITTPANNASSTANRRSSLTGDIENGPYVPSTIAALFLGGRVKALHGGHLVVSGIVWYRGRLPGINDDFVGIEIDQVGLGGDGTYQGHRYFRCAPGRGLFVPFRKIIMAWPPHLP